MNSKKIHSDQLIPDKLNKFQPEIIFAPKTLGELNANAFVLNRLKGDLSAQMSHYLKEYKARLDIPRLCRALAVPGNIAKEYLQEKGIKPVYEIESKLNELPIKILKMLKADFNLKETVRKNYDRQEATLSDLLEINVYFQMYCDIEKVFRERELSFEYIYGNSFENLIDILYSGALITRFKYVGEKDSKNPPAEKIVSYHPMSLGDETVLGVHVEGDLKFSMFKKWGLGDEKLVSLYTEYDKRVIRWGKEDLLLALDGKEEKNKEFLY